ncbi:MAG: hypothetical protein DWQ06_08765 [Calditrichaeota bacterium]|nr:MAG: hypothetical protein DWQ06_08765 [Calditrichota bacterium]
MDIKNFLNNSKATKEFKESVNDFLNGGKSDLIKYNWTAPRVKVERTLTKIVEELQDLPISKVEIDGSSGCEYFRGTAKIWAEEELSIDFEWNCLWKAEEEGYKDYFGMPDQIRAAREFGYDCFKKFNVLEKV